MSIGKRIAACRKEKNFSQEYIAELLEVSRQAVSKWETDQTEPDTGNLIKLAEVFGVSVEYLANGKEVNEKIIYVEKNFPIFEVIGIIFFSLGGLCLVLGAFLPLLLFIGGFSIIFGTLMLYFKKEGAILSTFIIGLSMTLFILTGIFSGVDNIIICIIFGISTFLPLLCYAIIKAFLKVKNKEFQKKYLNNSKVLKKVIFILGILIFTLIISIVFIIIHKNNLNKKWENEKWFSEYYLTDHLVSNLPKPTGVECINIDNKKILMYLDGNQYHAYASSIYTFLKNKKFKNLGTQGEVINISGSNIVYEFIDKNEDVYDFLLESVDSNDFKFIYSNTTKSVNTYLDCYVIYLNYVSDSSIIANNNKYLYNVELTIEYNPLNCVYKYKTYPIVYDDYYNSLFVDKPISESLPGDEIYFTTRLTDEFEYEVFINNDLLSSYFIQDDILYYNFKMPSKKAVIDIKKIEKTDENEPLKLKDFYVSLNNIDSKFIKSFKIIYSSSLSNIDLNDDFIRQTQITFDKTIIDSVLLEYQNIILKPLEKEFDEEYIDDTSAIINFIDGTSYCICFINDKYLKINDNYFEVGLIPTMLPYVHDQIINAYSLPLIYDEYDIYNINDEVIGNANKIYNLTFKEYVGDRQYEIEDCYCFIKTEIGELYIYNNYVFILKHNDMLYYYELVNTSFEDILNY